MLLLNFPDEILLLVAEAASEKENSVLSRTCRHLYLLLADFLHQTNIRRSHSSALFWAIDYDRIDIIRRMLDLGASADATHSEGHTALFEAARKGFADIVTLLLDRGATYPLSNAGPYTPVYAATVAGHTEVIRALLKRDDLNPMLTQAGFRDGLSGNDQSRMVSILFFHPNDDPSKAVPEYAVALRLAISTDHCSTAQALIESQKVDLDYQDRMARTALMWATCHRCERCIQCLLQNGADPNIRGPRGFTALAHEVYEGSAGVVRLLLADRRVGLNVRDDQGTVIYHIILRDHPEMLQALLARPDFVLRPEHIFLAVTHLGPACTRLLLDVHGMDPNIRDPEGRTPISWAAERGRLDAVELLLERGADPDAIDDTRRTPLSWAVESIPAPRHSDTTEQWSKVIRRLLREPSVQIDSKDTLGWTPLSWAVTRKEWAVARVLIDAGASLEVPGVICGWVEGVIREREASQATVEVPLALPPTC
ncbi:ankyrin repeat-containing domain protein [Aspergillus egyptiacus]|nr:ankyrin repeat-containing domain protein [Aspergillus egyptiacus]